MDSTELAKIQLEKTHLIWILKFHCRFMPQELRERERGWVTCRYYKVEVVIDWSIWVIALHLQGRQIISHGYLNNNNIHLINLTINKFLLKFDTHAVFNKFYL